MLKLGAVNTNGGIPEGVWVEYSDGIKFKIRKLTVDAFTKVRKEHSTTSMEFEPKARKMIPSERVDESAFDDAMTDYLIADWEGCGDEEGNPLPKDSLDSKKRIMNHVALKEFIWGYAYAVDTAEQEKHQDEKKILNK